MPALTYTGSSMSHRRGFAAKPRWGNSRLVSGIGGGGGGQKNSPRGERAGETKS